MTPGLLYAGAGIVLYAAGVVGLFLRPNLLRKIIAANVAGSGVFLFLVGGNAPAGAPPDPVPQAMVLTGIVITVAVIAYALSLLRRIIDESGRDTLAEDAGEP